MRTRRSIRWLRRGREPERGAALVEFALILPVFMALVLGMFTGGLAYNRKLAMTDAVREGARFGATLNDSTGWPTDVQTRVAEVGAGDITADRVCAKLVRAGSPNVQVRFAGDLTKCGAEPAMPTVSAGKCVALVWAGRTSDLQVFFFSRNLNLRATAVSAYERGTPAGSC